MKLRPAGAGMSLPAVQPPANGSRRRRPRRPASVASTRAAVPVTCRYNAGRAARNAHTARAQRARAPVSFCSNSRMRSRRSIVGKGMLMGQTSRQRPFIVQALGRSEASRKPTIRGVNTEPMGP